MTKTLIEEKSPQYKMISNSPISIFFFFRSAYADESTLRVKAELCKTRYSRLEFNTIINKFIFIQREILVI